MMVVEFADSREMARLWLRMGAPAQNVTLSQGAHRIHFLPNAALRDQ